MKTYQYVETVLAYRWRSQVHRHCLLFFGLAFGLATGLGALPLGAFAQSAQVIQTSPALSSTTSGNSRFGGVYVEVPSSSLSAASVQQNAATTLSNDSQSYCFFSGKAYSEGARLNGQVCAHPDDSNGGNSLSTVPSPLQWVAVRPARRYTRSSR